VRALGESYFLDIGGRAEGRVVPLTVELTTPGGLRTWTCRARTGTGSKGGALADGRGTKAEAFHARMRCCRPSTISIGTPERS